jgi:hypothetical protein
MTYYAATMALAAVPQAFSDTANSVAGKLAPYRTPSAAQIDGDIVALLEQEQADAELLPVDLNTVRAALTFARLLPQSLPAPEVAADPDGEVSFDWLGQEGKIFSVSVGRDGRISYAGRFGDRSKIHGIEQLSETLALEIVRGIQKAVR